LKKSFTIPCTDAEITDFASLMPQIVSETGSETEAASILRSLERLGTDPSILFYEMTLVTRGPRQGGVATSAWRVRADRGAPAVVEADPAVGEGQEQAIPTP
jgi:hypothetical protein